MNNILSISLSVALMMSQGLIIVGTPQTRDARNGVMRVEHVKSHPEFAGPFNSVAQFKIVSRKGKFHLGEMITLDAAMLNASGEPMFFHELNALQVKAHNLVGDGIVIQSYGVADRTIVPRSFTRVPSNDFLHSSIQLLVGCDRSAFEQMRSADKDNLTIFNSNSFVNWGDACVQVTQPGTYVLTVEVRNDYILLVPRSGRIKTAVGKITSNPLEITIVN